MTASMTNSISMCSSYTEGSAGEVQEKTTTSKTTSSPSTYSDNEKDFLIDDDYKVKTHINKWQSFEIVCCMYCMLSIAGQSVTLIEMIKYYKVTYDFLHNKGKVAYSS